MPKGQTSRPTSRGVKKVTKRTANKTVKKRSTGGALFGQNQAAGVGTAQARREARKMGAAFDKAEATLIRRGIAAKKARKAGAKQGRGK